jgi:hypothetical protein
VNERHHNAIDHIGDEQFHGVTAHVDNGSTVLGLVFG